jgi:hypothetical protein
MPWGTVSESALASADHGVNENEGTGEMGKILRLVLDVLKPHNPSIIQLAEELSDLSGVEAVNISINEIDQRVENAKITLEGTNLSYDEVLKIIGENGGTVHSIDEVVAGCSIIEDSETPQDALS